MGGRSINNTIISGYGKMRLSRIVVNEFQFWENKIDKLITWLPHDLRRFTYAACLPKRFRNLKGFHFMVNGTIYDSKYENKLGELLNTKYNGGLLPGDQCQDLCGT